MRSVSQCLVLSKQKCQATSVQCTGPFWKSTFIVEVFLANLVLTLPTCFSEIVASGVPFWNFSTYLFSSNQTLLREFEKNHLFNIVNAKFMFSE